MSVALKKSMSPGAAAKSKRTAETVRIVSEVDTLIARLKMIRKSQSRTGSFDIHRAIKDGRA